MAPPWLLAQEWQVGGFTSPESAIYDPRRDVIYVSNVNGYEENGVGFLSSISIRGVVLEQKWLSGLNAPTGMAIDADTLYVVDFNRLVVVDIPTQTIRALYESPDDNPGLNDIALGPGGAVYISGSARNSIYRLKDGALTQWIQSDELKFANGLHADGKYLFVAGFYLRRIDVATGEITNPGTDERLEDLESIEPDGAGGYFITQIGAKPIMHRSSSGTLSSILRRDTFSADVDFVAEKGLLIVPSGENMVVGFSAAKSPTSH